MRDCVILKFEARVQIYVAVLNIGCKIQNSGGNVVSFTKINSCEISFSLFLFKNMRIIRFLLCLSVEYATKEVSRPSFSVKTLLLSWATKLVSTGNTPFH